MNMNMSKDTNEHKNQQQESTRREKHAMCVCHDDVVDLWSCVMVVFLFLFLFFCVVCRKRLLVVLGIIVSNYGILILIIQSEHFVNIQNVYIVLYGIRKMQKCLHQHQEMQHSR